MSTEALQHLLEIEADMTAAPWIYVDGPAVPENGGEPVRFDIHEHLEDDPPCAEAMFRPDALGIVVARNTFRALAEEVLELRARLGVEVVEAKG